MYQLKCLSKRERDLKVVKRNGEISRETAKFRENTMENGEVSFCGMPYIPAQVFE